MKAFSLLLFSLTACAAQPFTLRNQSRTQLDLLLFGKNDTNSQWQIFTTNGLFNPESWVAPLDFSGVSTNLKLMLITKRHAITAAHIAPQFGVLVYFRSRNGQLHTGMVQSSHTTSNDFCVVSLMFDVADCIKPFAILPPAYTNWLEGGDIGLGTNARPVEVIWLRPNTGRANVKMANRTVSLLISGNHLMCDSDPGWPAPQFTEGNPTSGDSGGPVFLLVNGEPVLLFSTYAAPGPAGPLANEHIQFIESICGASYPLRYANLGRYEKP